METVNNLAAAASKAIWGEQPAEGADRTESSNSTGVTVPKSTSENETKGQEPLSGVLGDVGKGEPFDKGNEEPSSTSASTTATDSVLESTKVLPLRPSGEAPAPSENIESSTTSKTEELKEKVLPTVPTTHAATPNSTSTPFENIANPTPFVSGLQGAETTAVQGAGGQQIAGAKTVDSPVGVGAGVVSESLPKKENAGADTSAVQGAGGAQIPGAKIADSPAAAENARLPAKKESHTTEPSAPIVPPKTISGNVTGTSSAAPIVPSKVDSEDTTLSSESHEGKEKLSLKDKIKAKLHHHKD